MVVDDKLRVLSAPSRNLKTKSVSKSESQGQEELDQLKESLRETPNVFSLINCCKTIDQVSFDICIF